MFKDSGAVWDHVAGPNARIMKYIKYNKFESLFNKLKNLRKENHCSFTNEEKKLLTDCLVLLKYKVRIRWTIRMLYILKVLQILIKLYSIINQLWELI